MDFDKWFNAQSVLVKAILLLIPVVGWVVEFLVRLSVVLRTKKDIHIIVLILFVVIGWGWILEAVDFIYCMLTGKLILTD